jgi:hypothetical protein
MEQFIVCVTAKYGHEEEVAKYYQETDAFLKTAKGFHGRKVYQAENGKMVEAVHRYYTPEELAAHPEPPHGPQGVDFIVIESWENVDARMDFSKNQMADKTKGLVQHLEPSHSHEFFKDISVA